MLHEIAEFHGDRVLTATADENGNIFNIDFAPEQHDIGVRFYLTASGANSQTQATFADAACPVTNAACKPSGLSATAVSATEIDLSWTDNSTNETEFHVERSADGGSTFAEIAVVAGSAADATGGTFTYNDTSLSCGQSRVYRVRAHKHAPGAGFSDYSSTASATTSACNTAPVAGGQSVTTDEDTPKGITLSGTDAEGNSLTFTITASPAHGSLGALGAPSCSVSAGTSTCTAAVTYSPALNYNGADSFKFKVNDGTVDSAEATVSITVTSVNDAPVLDSIGDKSVDEGSLLSFTATATDADAGQTLTFSLVNGTTSCGSVTSCTVPAGASINSSTGAFTWTPSESQGPGTYRFKVKVTDDGSPNLSDDEEITVTVAEVNLPPVLDSIGNNSLEWGNLLSFTATATDPDVPANTLSFSLIGAPAGASITSGGAFTWTPTSGQIGSHTFKVRVTDDGAPPLCDEEEITVTVQKRSTTLVYGGVSSVQYSDPAHFSARLTDAASGDPLSGKTITFTLGTQSTSDDTDGSGVAEKDLVITQAPGSYSVLSDFAGDSLYKPSSDSDPFPITKEDARAFYTGTTFAWTASPTSSTATVAVSATIQDITAFDPLLSPPSPDSYAGDISKATVSFVNRDTNPDTVLCTTTVALVNPADTKTGTAACNAAITIPGSGDSYSPTVGIIVNGYYTRDSSSEDTVVTVSKPLSTNFITGGGYLVMSNSAGAIAGWLGTKTNFGFNVKYNKSGKNLQGNVNIIVRSACLPPPYGPGTGYCVYQIKSTAIDSLGVTLNDGKAQFNSKANIQDVTNPASLVPIAGNLILQMMLTDNGEPGRNDTVGITVTGGSTLWFSSNWGGSPPKTLEQLLGGCNLVVH